MIVKERGKWNVYSEGTPRKHLGGPYDSKEEAIKRLRQVEAAKAGKL